MKHLHRDCSAENPVDPATLAHPLQYHYGYLRRCWRLEERCAPYSLYIKFRERGMPRKRGDKGTEMVVDFSKGRERCSL